MTNEKIKTKFKCSLLGILFLLLAFAQTSCVAGGGNLEGLETMSIPVTIAKLTYELDENSFAYEAAISEEALFTNTDLSDDTVIGYITGALADGHNEATIGVLLGDTYIDTFDITDGTFSYALTLQYYNEPLAFVVMSENTTTTNNGLTSSAVKTLLTYDADAEVLVFIVSVSTDEDSDEETVISTSPVADPLVVEENEEEIAPDADAADLPQEMSLNVRAHSLGRVFPEENINAILDLPDQDAEGNDWTYAIDSEVLLGTILLEDNKITYTPQNPFEDDVFIGTATNGIELKSFTVSVTDDIISESDLASDVVTPKGAALVGKSATFAAVDGVRSPTVAYDVQNKNYVMYFDSRYVSSSATCPEGVTGIGRADSSDGITWTQHDSLIFEAVAGGDYACGMAQPSVVFDGDKYHLVFAINATGSVANGLAYSSSTDGLNFTAPVRISSGDKTHPSILMVNGRLIVYYIKTVAGSAHIAREWSNDGGTTWDEATFIEPDMLTIDQAWSDGNSFESMITFLSHSVFYDVTDTDKPYKMYVVAGNAAGDSSSTENPFSVGGLLESADGSSWGLSEILPPQPNPGWGQQPEVLPHGHNYLAWYSTMGSGGKFEIHFATTYENWPE